jgi:hypothetical protein
MTVVLHIGQGESLYSDQASVEQKLPKYGSNNFNVVSKVSALGTIAFEHASITQRKTAATPQ